MVRGPGEQQLEKRSASPWQVECFFQPGVYFAFVINWYAENVADPETVDAFFAAIYSSLTSVKTKLEAFDS